ncbi:MAG: traS protein [Kingella sp. (in: b-proteobacteria)]|nr:MAG: traS protein [Kingella sp. (in: b-proteobacteria)]
MKNLDDWFLQYRTNAVHGKQKKIRSSTSHKPLKNNTALTNLQAAARKHPEVMVKIPKRHSQNSKGMKGIRNHLDYISRNGEVVLENQNGEQIQSKKAVRQHLENWQNRFGIADDTAHREALNIVLSMPAGTPPQAVLNAAREFAAEQFSNHEYVFALHHESDREGEPPHPHVHLAVLMRDNLGQRINPRKNDLFEWRVRFAEKLRDEGVQCAATRRQHRGKSIKGENGIVRAIDERLAPARQTSRITAEQQGSLKTALETQQRPHNPYQTRSQETRSALLKRYQSLAKQLYLNGMKTEARDIAKLAQQVAQAGYDTRAQKMYDQIRAQLEQQRKQTMAQQQPKQQNTTTQPKRKKTQTRDDGMER